MGMDLMGMMGGGGGGGDLNQMFASQRAAGDIVDSTYGRNQRRQVRDYLSNPYPVSGAESAEAEYFGAMPDAELLDIFNIRKQKRRNRALQDYYENYDYAAAAERARTSPFNQQVEGTVGDLETYVTPTARDLLSTGLRTSIDPIIAEERRRLMEETAPALGSRYRTALRSSGFERATGDALEDLAVRLGTLNFNADEAANVRRANAITSGSGASALQLPLNLRLGSNLVMGSAGERARGRFESVRPGARLLSGLSALSGIETAGGFIQQGSDPSGGGMADLGAIFSQMGGMEGMQGMMGGMSGGGGMTQLPASGGPMSDPFAYKGIA